MQRVVKACVTIAVALVLPTVVLAQEGQIAGTVRDSSGGVIPGVLVEATSPALIERVRSTVTDGSGQYRITSLPVGRYSVTFTLDGFQRVLRDNVVLTSGFTASVNATMTVGALEEVLTVVAETPSVDIQTPRQVTTFLGEDLRELPTPRQVRSLMALTPGIVAAGLGADCVGGAGVWCNPNVYNLAAHAPVSREGVFTPDPLNTDVLSQGRIMVDGQVVNAGSGSIQGLTGGYAADIVNAQEVNIQISGALGESETGGVQLNVVPRTGGNRYAGNFFASHTRQQWFARNNGAYPNLAVDNTNIISDRDLSLSMGGPIKRDRLWFYSTARTWYKEAWPGPAQAVYNNANLGLWGANYEPANFDPTDPQRGALTFTNLQRNINARITLQATARNKFNIFWDEQDTCLDPCDGVVSTIQSPESVFSGQVKPMRLTQVTWTNPFTSRVLFEAGLTRSAQYYDYSGHRYVPSAAAVPRIVEFCLGAAGTGTGTGANSAAFLAVNNSCQLGAFGMLSGPLNSPTLGPAAAEFRDNRDYRTRASVSYVTGTHNAKFGYDGGFYRQSRFNTANDPRLTYRYDVPAANCTATAAGCGNTSLYYPNDPTNLARRPVPSRVTINTGAASVGTNVTYAAFYAQDQWTLQRFTLSGALRYDHATSHYRETCIGPDVYVPVQGNGTNSFCLPAVDGVSYHDINPRWGATWDVFGTGRTALKYNMGRYPAAASIGGIYSGQNLAARGQYDYTRTWNDVNGNRRVDCDLLNFAAQDHSATGGDICGGPGSVFLQDPTRYGLDLLALNAQGLLPGLGTTYCGSAELGIPAEVQAYCDVYGDNLLQGWGKRRYEWQMGIGIQHELLPRLSGEVTYNRTTYHNFARNDLLGIGCDRFNSAQEVRACQQGFMNYTSPDYDFFSVQAPQDPRLPNGGGYVVRGASNPKATLSTVGRPTAITIMQELEYTWSGVDTNFVWRAPGGLRVNGGTSTGRSRRDTCFAELDGPQVLGREGREYGGGCRRHLPFQTNLRGSATYTIPRVDLLVSTVFQRRPGVERSALATFSMDQVMWEANSAHRATQPCTGAEAGQVGCFVPVGVATTATTTQVDLLGYGELYGEPYTLIDLKFAKNIRFRNTRLNIGVDVYNLFNNDAIRGYNNVYTLDGENNWGQPTALLSPRFARLQVQFDF